MDGNIIRGNIETIILNILRNGELYGLEIIQRVSMESGGTFELKKPTLYSALKRLQRDKFIIERNEPSAFGGDRKYFSLTDKGHAYLADKKFDWLFSKNVIDNLVLERDIKTMNDRHDELESNFVTEAATKVDEFLNTHIKTEAAPAVAVAAEPIPAATISTPDAETAYANTAVAVATSPTVSVATHAISPVEEYAAKSAKFEIPVAISSAPFVTLPLSRNPQRPATQIAFNIDKLSALGDKPVLRGFVKHANDPKSGKFVFHNRVRVVSAFFVALAMNMMLGLSFIGIKNNYSFGEYNFFVIGAVAIAVYLLSNLVLYSAQPKLKRVASRTSNIAMRAILSACFAVSAISLCVLFGAGNMNFRDFLVYMTVPCIIGSVFVLEGVAHAILRRVPFFLT